MRITIAAILITAGLLSAAAAPEPPAPAPSGDAVIRAPAGGSEIVIRTASRFAGAIHSLTWGGKEFIDDADHGRELQSASNLDVDGKLSAETFNPTEAGSMSDGAKRTTTSRLLKIHALGPTLETTTQMAFWLRPGEKSNGMPALNATPLSDHLLTKRVHVGHGDLANVIEYDVTYTLPAGEKHQHAVFEALTGYMPPEFNKFWTFDPATSKIAPLTPGPGEQPLPIVFSTPDGRHAMGIFCPQPTPDHERGPSYGRWNFAATPPPLPHANVVKWNCVFRADNDRGIPPGDHKYRMFIPVGTLEDVHAAMVKLNAEAGQAAAP